MRREMSILARTSLLLSFVLAATFSLFTPALSQSPPEGEPVEVPLAYDFGVGARAMGMGGAHIAVVEDASAIYYNPAGLAMIRRIELGAAFSYQDDVTYVDYRGEVMDSPLTSTDLHQVSLVYPVPTYRGSLVLGFAYHRTVSLDRNYFRSGANDVGQREVEDIAERGGMGMYSIGVGFDASSDISLGASLSLLGGSSDIDYLFSLSGGDGGDYWYTSDADIDGVTGSLGMLYKFEPMGRFGLMVNFPKSISLDGTYEDADFIEVFSDDITLPFSVAGGIAITPPNFVFALDLEFTDWSQIDFEGPIRYVDQYGRRRSAYGSTTKVRAGVEALIPDAPVRLRAGYVYDPIPYKLFFTDNSYHLVDIEEERDYFTFGGGIILQKAVTLDFAFVTGGFVRSAQGTVEEADHNRVFVSAGYRY
jgi:long-subunit fatty acid transport protein